MAKDEISLEDYIKTVLTQISNAINDCNSGHVYSDRILVNPALKNAEMRDNKNWYIVNTKDGTRIRVVDVEFETSLSATRNKDKEGGIAIKTLKMGISKSSNTDNANRIKFTIPIVFPSSNVDNGNQTIE